MRLYILRALVRKEFHRHVSNKGGLVLAALLVVAAILLAVFKPTQGETGAVGGEFAGVRRCYIEYAAKTELIVELEKRIPEPLKNKIQFRAVPPQMISTPMVYEIGTGAIRVVDSETLKLEVWHPPGDVGAMAMYEEWLFRTVRDILSDRAKLPSRDSRKDDLWAVDEAFKTIRREATSARSPIAVPEVQIRREGLGAKPLDYGSTIATALVVFALYFTCCYLLPTLNCEERERGVLLAQALSPASPVEIVAAKFLFYPMIGVGLAAILAGIYNPGVLSTLFFWLSLLAQACGFLGIGMTVSTLAKTQRAAFLGGMCYLFAVSLLLLICALNNIPFLAQLAIESHGPKILRAAMTDEVFRDDWLHLLATFGLASVWMTLAAWLFRKRGWQ